MVKSVFLLIVLYYVAKHLCIKIKEIKIDKSQENDANFWMLTYDFKSIKKDSIFDIDSQEFMKKKREKNKLIIFLYLTSAAIFVIVNLFVAQLLNFIAYW
tara:strand:+ start:1664 stop:1963 length:300 start_codon:yes stop_codon:yes gene_type:complete